MLKELFQEINDLSEKVKVAEGEQKMLTAAKEKTETELKKLREQIAERLISSKA